MGKRREDSSDSEPGAEALEKRARKEADEPNEETKQRHNMWRTLNNNGVTTRGDVQRKYVGQVTDAALDARLREHHSSSSGGKLMTEAEAMAKLHKKKS